CGGQEKDGRQSGNQDGRMPCSVHRDLADRPRVMKNAGEAATCSESLRLCRQRSTNQFLLIACKNMTIRISRRGPGDLPPSEGVKRAQQSRAADLLVALGSQLRPNQLSPVRVEEDRVSLRSEMNARPTLEVRDLVGLPDLLAGG